MPKLSILLPTYNGAPYLAEQLESILAQTDGDFELLAIDDGSSDDTIGVLDAFAERDGRIARLPSTGNIGQNARLVELLGRARGEYIAVADQDDRWAAERNAHLLEAIGTSQLAFGQSQLIDAVGTPMGKSLLDLLYGGHQSFEPLSALIQPMFSAHAMVIRRDAIRIAAFAHALPFDWLLALEAMFGNGAVYRDDAVVFHRLHDSNQCNNLLTTRGQGKFRPGWRHALLFRSPARFRLVAVFDYLGKSDLLSAKRRRAFASLARECETVWFSEWRTLRPDHAALRESLVRTLTPLAGSDNDARNFRQHVEILTRPTLSRPVLNEMRRRYSTRST